MNTKRSAPINFVLGFLSTLAITAVLILFQIPHFNVIMNVVLVAALIYFEYIGGIASGLVFIMSDCYRYTSGFTKIAMTSSRLQEFLIITASVAAIIFMVGHLSASQRKALKELKTLNEILTLRNSTLKEQSQCDGLTTLKNRSAFRSDFNTMIDRYETVIFFDIDDFKKFNDSYGHGTGDVVISSVAAEVIRVFGREYSYRYGGDEFIVVIPYLSEIEIQKSINKMQADLIGNVHEGKPLPISITAGYCFGYAKVPRDLRGIMHQADLNLYYSKARQKGTAFGSEYYPEDVYTVAPETVTHDHIT